MRRKSLTSDQVRRNITFALLELMEKKSFSSITVDQIATQADVNRSSFYRHFGCKEDVITYFFVQIVQNYLAQLPTPSMQEEVFMQGLFREYWKYRKQLLTVYRSGKHYLMFSATQRNFSEKLPPPDTDLSEQYKIAFYVGGICHFVYFWMSRHMKDTPEEIAQYAMATIPADQKLYLMMSKVEAEELH